MINRTAIGRHLRIGFSGSWQGPVAGCCEPANAPFDPIKARNLWMCDSVSLVHWFPVFRRRLVLASSGCNLYENQWHLYSENLKPKYSAVECSDLSKWRQDLCHGAMVPCIATRNVPAGTDKSTSLEFSRWVQSPAGPWLRNVEWRLVCN